jgi:superfamily II DNA or RNA helicase
MKITHRSIYQVFKDDVFKNVNSYRELNDEIKKYGESLGSPGSNPYNDSVGMCFEIFTQFFCMKYGETPLIGMKNVMDTSDDAFNQGYDFTFESLSGKNGQIQSKWRSNTSHQFTLGELATNSSIASDMDIEKDNNILFLNIDDTDRLFHYSYPTARNKRRVIGRNAQEEYILRDIHFWDDFRNCIKKSSEFEFKDPFKLRDTQEWVRFGHEKNGIKYLGTEKVLDGSIDKGRVCANTGAGKTLNIYEDVNSLFRDYDKSLAILVFPTRDLITQTFKSFYIWKMFGYIDSNGNEIRSDVSGAVIMSGDKVRFIDSISNIIQDLDYEKIVKFIKDEISLGRKVVVFTTLKSKDLKYEKIVDKLKELNIRINLEIYDEFHNIISSSSDRKKQLEIAEYLQNTNDRSDSAIFYSASNKDGDILSSFNEDLFGPLLAFVSRNDLRERGYVVPQLLVKFVRVKTISNSSETKRDSSRVKLDIDKAQSESVGIITAFNDLKKIYDEPNIITFGDHVEGCRYISSNEEFKKYLPNVEHYFVSSEIRNSERSNIYTKMKSSGNNILHQHSVAKEGVDIPGLHSPFFGRGMNIIGIQQGIGRSDRAVIEDTINFEKGLITLDSPIGWKKYYNVIYIQIEDDETFANRLRLIVKYLMDQGIPEDQWDISFIEDDDRGGSEYKKPDYETSISTSINFDSSNFKKMIERAKIDIIESENKIQSLLEEEKKKEEINSTDWFELMNSKNI